MSLSLFSDAHLLLGTQTTLRNSLFPRETPLKNTKFSFSDINWVRDRAMCPLLLSALGPHVVQAGAGRCRPLQSPSLSVFRSSRMFRSLISLVPCVLSGSYILFASSSAGLPDPEKSDLMEISHLELNVSRSLALCIISGCGSLYLSPSAA